MIFPGRTDHEQVILEHAAFGAVEVDRNIAPLIEGLWAAGISTLQCCEVRDDFGRAWIQFATRLDAAAFLDALTVERDERNRDSLYERIGDGWLYGEDCDTYDEPRQWRFEVQPEDLNNGDAGTVEFGFNLSAYFPPLDISELVERLRPAQPRRRRRTRDVSARLVRNIRNDAGRLPRNGEPRGAERPDPQ